MDLDAACADAFGQQQQNNHPPQQALQQPEVEFEYTGKGCVVPKDVRIVRFHLSVVEVEQYAFKKCFKLREVVFNDGLQKIGRAAFYNCKSLSSVSFPSTVTEIGYLAFRNCASLKRFTFPTISNRLDTLIQTGRWEEVDNEMDEIRGVVERSSGGELFVSTQTMGGSRNWNRVRRDIEKIVRLVVFYESQLPILDIAFTDACDIGVPGPVKDKVLQYLF